MKVFEDVVGYVLGGLKWIGKNYKLNIECVNFVVLCIFDMLVMLVEMVFIFNLDEEWCLIDLVY